MHVTPLACSSLIDEMTARLLIAVWLIVVWSTVVLVAAVSGDDAAVSVATITTPVALIPAGWLFGSDFIRSVNKDRKNGHT